MNQKYTKQEKLKSRRQIEYLFLNGHWINKFPLKMIYCKSEMPLECIQFGVSVSKKNFKHAVDRNRIKRLMRECFRLHKKEIYEIFPKDTLVMMIFVGKELPKNYEDMRNYFMKLRKKSSEKEIIL